MKPYFNTSGPCVADSHYMLPPERRLVRVMELVEEGRYFTLHAGRQTGKTTSARWLVAHYNAGTDYCAAWVDLQTAREKPDPKSAFRTVLNVLDMALECDLPRLPRPTDHDRLLQDPETAVLIYLKQISAQASRPLVLFFDEADGLVGEAMVSFLTQLRAGYLNRDKQPFPHSLALIGMRQVRDYVLASKERNAVSWLGTTSPFNISAEASTLAAFSKEDVVELLGRHTEATGQCFAEDACGLVHELSQGHPWLVNALADKVVREAWDRDQAIKAERIESAKESIIIERRTHIDSLIARLREPRVRRIIEPMLTGGALYPDGLEDDLHYVCGMGLIGLKQGMWQVANPIYREVIPRALTFVAQTSLAQQSAWYVREDGTLNMAKLLTAFQEFWREDGHLAAEGFFYREAGPHLMLMAFLQRITNSGGRVHREYGLGRGVIDLLVEWQGERHAIEIKMRRDQGTEQRGFEQLGRYLDTIGLMQGWLVLFDLRKTASWEEKVYRKSIKKDGKIIHVVGC